MISLYNNRWWFFGLKCFSALGFFYPIWYLYEQQYLTLSEIALLEGIIVAIKLVLEIPTGAIADIFGTKISIALGYLIQAVACLIFLVSRNFLVFLIYAFLLGLGESLKSGAEEALEYDSLKAIGKETEFPKYKGWYSLTFHISLAFAFITGGLLASFSLLIPIWMTAVAFTIAAIIVMLMVEPPKTKIVPSFSRYAIQLRQGWHELTSNNYIKHLTQLYVGVGIVSWTTNISLLNIYLGQLGFNPSEVGVVQGIIRILNVILIMKLIKPLISAYITPKIYLFFTFVFLIGYVPAFFLTKWESLGVICLIMISTNARWIVLGSFLNRHISSDNRATALSTASMLISLGHMSIMLASAPLMPLIGGTKTFISLLGIIGVSICLWLLKNNQKVIKEYLYAYKN